MLRQEFQICRNPQYRIWVIRCNILQAERVFPSMVRAALWIDHHTFSLSSYEGCVSQLTTDAMCGCSRFSTINLPSSQRSPQDQDQTNKRRKAECGGFVSSSFWIMLTTKNRMWQSAHVRWYKERRVGIVGFGDEGIAALNSTKLYRN